MTGVDLTILLAMAAEGLPNGLAVGSLAAPVTFGELLVSAQQVGAAVKRLGFRRVVHLAQNSNLLPSLLFGSAEAGIPFVPLNYRLSDDRLRALLGRVAPALLVVEDEMRHRATGIDGLAVFTTSEFQALASAETRVGLTPVDPEAVALQLFTSGTTGDPKAAVLRHRHLTSYVVSTVEFLGAGPGSAALVSVPSYHIAGMAAILTSVYGGRRLVYLPQFDPQTWVDVVVDESITHAMVVPTMLTRILDVIEARGEQLPGLKHLAYGGGRMPVGVLERALTLLPAVGLVNAYGLTETASTIAILGPDEHRAAFASNDPLVRCRLGSVGRPLPSLELEIRGPDGVALPPGERGEIVVRGEQISGEYLDSSTPGDSGWFATKDAGWVDVDGFLFVDGRLDDVIVRGGENMSPGEIEDVLVAHPAVADAGVIGIPDDEWGEAIAATVVLVAGAEASVGELQRWVHERLRSSKTPAVIEFRDALPYNETGKLLRRQLRLEMGSQRESA